MSRDVPPSRPTGAEQRALRQQAESEQLRKQQAQAQQRRMQIESEQRRRQQAQQQSANEQAELDLRLSRFEQQPRQSASPPGQYPPGGGRQGRAAMGSGGPPHPPRQYQPPHGGDYDPPSEERPKVRNRWFTALLMVVSTLALCVFLSLFLVQSAFDLFGLNQEYNVIQVTIPEGAEISDIVRILGQAGVVNQPLTFRLYLDFRAVQSESLLPGEYLFNSRMSYDELIRAMMTGRVTREVVRLTFIEGWTLWEFARHLEENGVVDAEVFIEYLNTAEFGFEFFHAIERHPLRFHMLEGYLFPDTYDFYIGENVSSVARKFLRNFNDRVMTPQLLRRMDEMNMTVDETIILASIIQREAGLSDDMRLVSSVFHNRLRSPNFPHLQSDVTIMYLDREIRPRLEAAGRPVNQAQFDAYCTYVVEGLPIGAVCNPGMDAIMAALHPEDTPFFFFVTDEEGDFYYAVTYERHRQNILLAQAVGDGVIHGTDTQGY